MAIVTKFYKETEDGMRLVRTYSDINHLIERDGALYEEAIDPEEMGRVYTETDIPIGGDKEITGDEFLAMVEEVL